ncbi:MAG: alkaline phosphatase family protein [Acidobacteriota bacterium]|nr:alkaline phosphatase family protein [Acidobacteriota bacterium]
MRWAGVGFVHGALVYGGLISLLHVVHNRMPSVRDAVVLLAISALVYGTAGAAIFAGGGIAGRLGCRLVPSRWGRAGRDGGLLWPAFTFTLAFWYFYFNYALSYDQLPMVDDPDVRHILVLLAVRSVLVGVCAWGVAWLFNAIWQALARRSQTAAACTVALLALVAAHVAAAWRYQVPAEPSATLEDVPRLETAADAAPKVVLLGIDGAEWSVIHELLERGELTHLRRYVDEGSTGNLNTIPDANSPLIWASIYTGEPPDEHSIHDFYTIRLPGMSDRGFYPVHRTYFKEIVGVLESIGVARRVTVDRSNLRSVLLWEAAYGMGRDIGVVDGYYYSFPTPELGEDAGFYLAYGASEYLASVRDNDRDEALDGLFAHPATLLKEQRPQGKDFAWQSKALLSLLDAGDQPAFVNLYTHEPDSSQHWYWKWYQPKYYLGVRDSDIEEFGSIVPDFYREFDAFLGELEERIDDDTIVMIVSDHGHVPCILHQHMQTWHRHGPPGVVLMRGGPVKKGHTIADAHVFDVFPTVLHLLGLPVPEDGDGKVLTEALEPGATQVETIPSYDFLYERFAVTSSKGSAARNEAELERLRNLGYI